MCEIMASADPALCNFAAKHHFQLRCIPRFSPSHLRPTISTLSCRCALGSKSFPAPLAPTEASWSARARKKEKSPFYGVDREGFSSRVDRKAVERDASVTTSEEGGALELVDTDGISFEEGDGINGMLRQPRSYLNAENWQMFAADEGARPGEDDETGSESELEDGGRGRVVRRRKAEEIFESFPDTAAGKWTAADKERVRALHAFQHRHEGEMGSFTVEAMRPKHMNDTEELLVDSFAELMGGLLTYRPLLAFTVKQYVRERYPTLPHSVTLVGVYAPAEGGEPLVAGTVELSFSVAGHPDVPSPVPPPNSPYICNMAIRKEYRRRGLGRQMLKAAEDLALSLGFEDMYLHVRIMDTAPLTMYKEASYQVVSTDSLLSVLTFQRRRHLMRKRLCRAKLVPE